MRKEIPRYLNLRRYDKDGIPFVKPSKILEHVSERCWYVLLDWLFNQVIALNAYAWFEARVSHVKTIKKDQQS